jgi:ribonucleoside-diphosphate reductase alpha chain
MTKETYGRDEALQACTEYFNGDTLAAGVFINKYALRNKEGELLEKCPEHMHDRIACEFARIEEKYPNSIPYEEIYKALDKFKYIVPQGSPMFGIGNNEQLVSVGNCFVVESPEDSYASILWRDELLVQIMKRRGGCGIDISNLRPRMAYVNNAARSSSGAVSFAERYSKTTQEVAQGGRRGALLISLDCRHPDLLDFINIKNDHTKVTGANISVKWNDDFLKAVEKEETYTLRYPVDASIEEAKYTVEVNAKEVWEEFVKSNWASAEPGCLFWNTITEQSISDCYKDYGFETISTNPCGEITLSANGACILMVVNLASFVKNMFTDKAKYDFKLFEKYVRMAVRLVDDMIDLEIEKCDSIIAKIKSDYENDQATYARELNLWEKIRENYINGRRTGLGITGLGDAIAYMNMQYGSNEALEFVAELFSKFHLFSYSENCAIAKERGSFPIWSWDLEKDSHYINILPDSVKEDIQKYGRRNIAINTCAPTGSVSILTQTSSGIEPIFKRSYQRWRKMAQDDYDAGLKAGRTDSDGIDWIAFDVYHHGLDKWSKMYPNTDVKKSPYAKSEAGELKAKFRVDMQGIIQKFIDHSISSTCNLPEDVTVDEVSDLYLRAWKKGCKGFTIFRDNSREGVLDSKKEAKREESEIIETHAPKRPQILECEIHKSNVKNKKWIFFVGLHKGKPYEIFGGSRESIEIPNKYKTGWIVKNGRVNGRRQYDLCLGSLDDENDQLIIKDIASQFSPDIGSYTRIIATMLRHGVPIKFICEQLKKDDKECSMFSFESVAARILKKFIKDGEESGDLCSCGVKYVYKDGCKTCLNCGSSLCS